MIFIAPHWHVSSPHVPKFDGLMMTGHKVTLLVGVVIHAEDLIPALLASFNHVLVTEWN